LLIKKSVRFKGRPSQHTNYCKSSLCSRLLQARSKRRFFLPSFQISFRWLVDHYPECTACARFCSQSVHKLKIRASYCAIQPVV